jgi:hypothetical protein
MAYLKRIPPHPHNFQTSRRGGGIVKNLLNAAALIAALMWCSVAQQQEPPREITLGEVVRGIEIQEDSNAYFSVKVDKNRFVAGSNLDLVVKVFSEGRDESETDVYISKVSLRL